MYDVVVIGGGAAGMLASATAAGRGLSVVLLEKNRSLGRKLMITGKGRCNVTNNCSTREVLENITTGRQFLQSTITGFPPDSTMELFSSLGAALKTERGGRVFPESDKASDIVGALRRYLNKNGVAVKHCEALALNAHNGVLTGVKTTAGDIACGAAVLCTGGLSYPATGSTGDGYRMVRELGHTVTPLSGSLVPLEAEVCPDLQGLTLRNVKLSVFGGGKRPVFEELGELLFTHFGISGPLVLSASAHMREAEDYYAVIDLKPGLDEKKLDLRILRDFEKYSNRDFNNALGDLLNRLMIPVIVERSGIPGGTKVHSVSREQRMELLRHIKSFRIDIIRPRPVEEAVVTSGGIELREINPKTMESKLIKGLYFAGEIIDADAYTGGFNLQIAWSTGYSAGMHV